MKINCEYLPVSILIARLLVLFEVVASSSFLMMSTEKETACQATDNAVKKTFKQSDSGKPNLGIFFDCLATRLRLRGDFEYELKTVKDSLKRTKYARYNTHGQVAEIYGMFSGFHSCFYCLFNSGLL